jgi:selenocysteine lyase/cysteine desulfurase
MIPHYQKGTGSYSAYHKTDLAFAELEHSIFTALETYSNVHRGSGHKSLATTALLDHARELVLEYLEFDKQEYSVIFCTPARSDALTDRLKPGSFRIISSRDIGLPVGIRALAVKKGALPGGFPYQTGGGTARLVSPRSVVWAKAPGKFEAGTPSIVCIIAFVKALTMIRHYGDDLFRKPPPTEKSVSGILHHDDLESFTGIELLTKLGQSVIGGKLPVPTRTGLKQFINFDYAASTPTFVEVWDAFRYSWRQPETLHCEIVREVKEICAGFLGAPESDYEVFFTSNTTESINIMAESFNESPEGDTVVVNTIIEHNSNDLPWRSKAGVTLIRLSADDAGFVDPEELENLLKEYNQQSMHKNKHIRLVTVNGISNVLGTCNDIEEISRIVHMYGAQLMVDAAQLVAHREIDMKRTGIDCLAFSAHKTYAPFGTGVLVIRKGMLPLSTEKMKKISVSGEENVAGIAALGKALLLFQRIGMNLIRKEEQSLTKLALESMLKIPGLSVYGIKNTETNESDRKGGVIAFSLQNKMSDVVARELACQAGIGVRCGCHCAHLLVKKILHVGSFLEQLQLLMLTLFPSIVLPGVARVSFGIGNTREEIVDLVFHLEKIALNRKDRVRDLKVNSDKGFPILPENEVRKQIDDFVSDVVSRVYAMNMQL